MNKQKQYADRIRQQLLLKRQESMVSDVESLRGSSIPRLPSLSAKSMSQSTNDLAVDGHTKRRKV